MCQREYVLRFYQPVMSQAEKPDFNLSLTKSKNYIGYLLWFQGCTKECGGQVKHVSQKQNNRIRRHCGSGRRIRPRIINASKHSHCGGFSSMGLLTNGLRARKKKASG